MKSDKSEANLRGIVRRVDPKVRATAGDLDFGADYTVTSTTDNGGKVLTDVEVILCFWGSFWTTNPAPSPSSDDYKTAIEGILTGPYLGGLGQYRGVGQGTLIFTDINDATSPADLYTDADVVTMLKDRIANHGMPAPSSSHNRFYAVIVPQGIRNAITKFAGQHQSFSVGGATGWWAWVDNSGSLTGHNASTKVFSHELTEACTNPNVDTSNDGILVDGTQSDGTAVTNDEIGDTCNEQFATVDMNGVQCSVQAYWSAADNACILPLGTLAFWTDKDTFGKDEVQDVINTQGGKFEKAFFLIVEGFSQDSFNALAVSVPVPTGTFANIPGVTITQNPDIDFENGANPGAQQRIRIGFDVTFTSAALGHFPATGAQVFELDAFIATHGNKAGGTDASALFELVAGADPYFTNVDPGQNNVFYLSQDLRVFTATPGLNNVPVPGGPTLADSTGGAFSYIQQLLTWLNGNFSDPNGADPFNTVLPGQGGAFSGDSSVTPFTVDFSNIFNIKIFANYNFAIARVRLRGSSGPAGEARNTKVFFRLFTTQSPDTDFQPATYPSAPDAAGQPGTPQVGADHVTIPFFATGNLSGETDYAAGGANNLDVEIPAGDDSVWAYYGCFLNLYDGGNVIDGKPVQAWLNGNHHCLVAQIAFDDAPVIPGVRPEASDKLAQRNLQVTHSDNPGPASAHRIPQTFNIRPTAAGTPARQVDELMIDWGDVPVGAIGSIYWPQVLASDVLALARTLYRTHELSAADAHTIQCKVTGGITYVPIPPGSGPDLASLLTLDLPTTVIAGQEFNVVVRRVAQRIPAGVGVIAKGAKEAAEAVGRRPRLGAWRYVVGSFQVKIPVATAETLLRPEEDTLAILKWRLQQIAPSSRWHPVLQRYIEIVEGRVTGLGGDPGAIPASPNGAPVNTPDPCADTVAYCGKIVEVVFDCTGDFEGFILEDCCERHGFKTDQRGLADVALRACRDASRVCVYVARKDKRKIQRIIVRG
jgi:hypothetical protein